jgi:hypothetical protein
MPTTESSASGRKNPQIVKDWIDKGLAKCHEIAVLYPSSRNPPAWLGKIHGITFFTPPERRRPRRHQLATRYPAQRLRRQSTIHHPKFTIRPNPKFKIQNSKSIIQNPPQCYQTTDISIFA